MRRLGDRGLEGAVCLLPPLPLWRPQRGGAHSYGHLADRYCTRAVPCGDHRMDQPYATAMARKWNGSAGGSGAGLRQHHQRHACVVHQLVDEVAAEELVHKFAPTPAEYQQGVGVVSGMLLEPCKADLAR